MIEVTIKYDEKDNRVQETYEAVFNAVKGSYGGIFSIELVKSHTQQSIKE